jgi:uncharacterized protein
MSALALLLPLLATATATADPECAGAGDPIQGIICRDAALRARETEVQRLYKSAAHLLPPPQRAAQRSRQSAWLAERAQCAPDPDARNCMADAQGRRIVELKLALGELPVSASATYLCKGHEATPLTAAYFHSDPPAVRLRFNNQQAIAFAAPSGSGARYSAEGVELWEHQGVARFTWQGEEMECPKR